MEQLNRIELKGVVGNVRIQDFDGTKGARIGLTTNYCYKDRDGCAVIDTSWHNVIAWEGENIKGLDQITKGTSLHVVGRLRYQNYTATDGVDRVVADVVASFVEIIEGRLDFQVDKALRPEE